MVGTAQVAPLPSPPPLPTPNPPTPHSRVFFSGRRSLLQVDYRVYREEGGATAAATARIPVPVCRCVADRPLIDICAVGSLHRCQKTPLPPPPLPAFCPPLSPSPRRSPGLSPPLSRPLSPGSPGLSPPVSWPLSPGLSAFLSAHSARSACSWQLETAFINSI